MQVAIPAGYIDCICVHCTITLQLPPLLLAHKAMVQGLPKAMVSVGSLLLIAHMIKSDSTLLYALGNNF